MIDTLRLGGPEPDDLIAQWRGVPTSGLGTLVAYEGAAIWLFRRLRATGAIEAVPESFAAELRGQAMEAAGLALRIEETAVEVLHILSHAGIPVILIKGMARRALARTYPYLDARPTNDVDLLIEDSRVHDAFGLLCSSGFVEAKPGCAIQHHLPPLWNQQRVAVELHSSTSPSTEPVTAWSRAAEGALEMEWRDLHVRTPSPTELAWNAACHAVTPSGSIVVGFRLQQFLEVAALESEGPGIDWELLQHRMRTERLLDREFGHPVPIHVLRRWIGTAKALGSESGGGPNLKDAVDLAGLLGWRLSVLRVRGRLGRALTGRFMEEGPRTLIGAPFEGSPPDAPWAGRVRRRTAAIGSRVIFRTWRMIDRQLGG